MDSITRKYKFKDFAAALRFVNQIGVLAESLQHHPNILLHDYNQVLITLTTHDTGGVSDKDIQLAAQFDEIYAA